MGDPAPADGAPAAGSARRPSRRRRWRSRLRRALGWLAGAYLLAAFAATHVEVSPAVAGGVPHADKLVHAAIFFGLAVLTAGWRVTRYDSPVRARWVALALCLLYAVGDELTQLLTETRHADPLDFAADAAGTLLGLAAFGPLLRWYKRHA